MSTATETRTQAAKLCGYGVRLFGTEAFEGVDRDNAYEVMDRMKLMAEHEDTPASKAAAVDMLLSLIHI